MTKLTKWEKTELLNLYKIARKDLRCVMVQKLTETAKELTKTHRAEITRLTDKLDKVKTQQIKILDDNRLREFDSSSSYSCKISTLHETLITFDKETNTEIQKIIKDDQ